ncbi:MAG: hypothetical protein ACKVS9_01885 [Phycisphaerae bacterium]
MRFKPVTSLKRRDFAEHPIWSFADSDDEVPDETWVKPVVGATIPRGRYSLLVSARFVTASDRVLFGFMDVTTVDKIPSITPGAILHPRYLVLPLLSASEARKQRSRFPISVRTQLIAALSTTERDLYPIQYFLKTPLRGSSEYLGGLLT